MEGSYFKKSIYNTNTARGSTGRKTMHVEKIDLPTLDVYGSTLDSEALLADFPIPIGLNGSTNKANDNSNT